MTEPIQDQDHNNQYLGLLKELQNITHHTAANAIFPIRLQQQIVSVLSLIKDRSLACEFKRIFIDEINPAGRLRLIEASKLYRWGLKEDGSGWRTFLQNLVGVLWVADETGTLAGEVVLCLKEGADDAATLIHEARQELHNPSEQILVDEYGLPAIDPEVDWSSVPRRLDDREEAEAKLEVLKDYSGGNIVRWQKDKWLKGAYGDPQNPDTISKTGWTLERTPQTRWTPGQLDERLLTDQEQDSERATVHSADTMIDDTEEDAPASYGAQPRGHKRHIDHELEQIGTSSQQLDQFPALPHIVLQRRGDPEPLSEFDKQLIEAFRDQSKSREEQFRDEREQAKIKRVRRPSRTLSEDGKQQDGSATD